MPGRLVLALVGVAVLGKLLGTTKRCPMYQCSKEIKSYHGDKVTLPDKERTKMRVRRNSNRTRLKNGLEKNDDPAPIGQRTQGSYAMRTMIQSAGNKYDIDDGVYFQREDLEGANGADKSALATRQMVRDALDDGSFAKEPKLKKNCVRVYYQEGYHVDVPVYRVWEEEDDWGDVHRYQELASADWKDSDPLKVTEWFNDAMHDQSPPDDQTQFRRIVRMIKKFSNSRDTWVSQSPSGLTISKLVEEKYAPSSGDDEQALHQTMKSIKERLDWDLSVEHPVVDENLAEDDDPKTRFLHQKLAENLKHLEILDNDDCTKADALRAWKKVFNDDYFDDLIANEENTSNASKAGALAVLDVGLLNTHSGTSAVNKVGGGRFA